MNYIKNITKKLLLDIYWFFKGARIKNPIFPKIPQKLLFVCKGNICRSPFAEHNLKNILIKKGITNIFIDSAGIEAIVDNRSPLNAIISSGKYGVSLNNHRAKKINVKMLKLFDAIIVMEAEQMYAVNYQYPEIANKIFLLPLFYSDGSLFKRSYKNYNILDPYGKYIEDYIKCFEHINKCNNRLAKYINVL